MSSKKETPAHALLSASSAERWMNCPASVRLSEGMPDLAGDPAREGTLAQDVYKRQVWHLDVGSSHPGAEAGPKGGAVRPLKRHASWVQNVVRQFGPYPSWA